MKFVAKAITPINPPVSGLGRVVYDAGQWCCDNLSVLIAFIPAVSLLLRSLVFDY